VTSTGATTVFGDLGVSPGLAITGFPPGLVSGGATHAGDAVALQAQNDVTTAFDALSAQACDVDLTGKDLGGLTLTPGVYCFSSSAQLTGALVLDAAGKADAVFVFKTASTLTTASNASVAVINGGSDCGVFWQVGSSATIGTGTVFAGSILALASITLTTGAKVSGRVLARTGAVTMDDNAVALPTCAKAPVDAGVPDAPPSNDAATPDAAPADSGTVPAVDAGSPNDAGTDATTDADAGACDGISDAGASDAASGTN
jgi:type VI secretion system secreted protein VgrG